LLSEPTNVKIALHPEDRALIEDMLPRLHQSLQDGVHIGLVDDPALARGGCVLSTKGGDIDASIDTQVRRLAEALLPERAARSMVAGDEAE
jgi:flagellar assembly protein FliH